MLVAVPRPSPRWTVNTTPLIPAFAAAARDANETVAALAAPADASAEATVTGSAPARDAVADRPVLALPAGHDTFEAWYGLAARPCATWRRPAGAALAAWRGTEGVTWRPPGRQIFDAAPGTLPGGAAPSSDDARIASPAIPIRRRRVRRRRP